MRPPQIALIGTEGSGKTVLTTVLAKTLEKKQGNGAWLNPNAKTGKYIATTWNTLRSGEWVPSTPAGTLFDLEWVMQVGERKCPMRVIDSAGHDLRRLFSDDGFNDPNLADQDRRYIEYIRESTILLVLINLGDFLGEADPNKVIENGYTLKAVLDELLSDKERQIAFVFTAYDLYHATIKEKYGTVNRFMEKEISYLYHAYIDKKQPVKCFAVSAVADTEVEYDNNDDPYRVPAKDFTSKGLDPLIDWLAEAIVSDIQRQPPEPAPPAPPPRVLELPPADGGSWFATMFWIVAACIAIAYFTGIIGGGGGGHTPPPPTYLHHQ